MQHRPDSQLNGIVGTPVNSQLDLLLGASFRAIPERPDIGLERAGHGPFEKLVWSA
jgi:hypothetical protein